MAVKPRILTGSDGSAGCWGKAVHENAKHLTERLKLMQERDKLQKEVKHLQAQLSEGNERLKSQCLQLSEANEQLKTERLHFVQERDKLQTDIEEQRTKASLFETRFLNLSEEMEQTQKDLHAQREKLSISQAEQLKSRERMQKSTFNKQPLHIFSTKDVWEYHERNDSWLPFFHEHQQILQDAHRRNAPGVQLQVDGQLYSRCYTLSFAEMQQTNLETGAVRKIRKREDLLEAERRAREECEADLKAERKAREQVQMSLEDQREKALMAEAELRKAEMSLEDQLVFAWMEEAKLQKCVSDKDQLQKDYEVQRRIAEVQRRIASAAQAELVTCRQKVEEAEQLLLRLSMMSLSRLPSSTNDAVARLRIAEDEPEYRALKTFFEASMARHRKSYNSEEWCEKPDVQVTEIQQIINGTKQRLYEAARREVLARNPTGCNPVPGISAPKCVPALGDSGPDLNEYFLFHGTSFNAIDHILKNGLDPQRGGDSAGAMFGRGTYFAENASKSNLYTTCEHCDMQSSFKHCRHPTGTRCMMVAQVLLGESCPVIQKDPARSRAADRADGLPYDSHTALRGEHGGCVDHAEYVIFKEQHALVRFLIFYKHKSSCECKDCFHRRQ